ncbi:RNA polymerase sigma-70 factor (sigma-E family) [Stackebrandtia albiflava]|uniref:RNA polymerase sigma-70 factor (Sigma-E family) n=1 Tax=Stackebrandtia albiflava TaxID=406432 RepID=A0A562VCY2_9ACTN|nr:SigE family RNA polymerase sigma factor [Stackebrandtia albiflava]TWJ15715.1 RNA polymerase sigma-70 factor (sigma-E family) [Stackebrandtia albiflava]
MRPDQTTEFREYVVSRQERMRRFAYLNCGDWHRAEDLVQTAFVRLYGAWNRAAKSSLDSYTRRIIVNALIDERRRGWFRRERPTDTMPDRPVVSDDGTQRMAVMQALAALPAKRRATLILRYWEDLSVEETARVMRCSVNTVKSQTARGLQTLRGMVIESISDTPQGANK